MCKKKVLSIDRAETYGGLMSDFNLKGFLEFCILLLILDNQHKEAKDELIEFLEQKVFFKNEQLPIVSKECNIELYPKFNFKL